MELRKISICLFLLLFFINANAQIFKKIGNLSGELLTAAKNTIELAKENRSIQNIFDEINEKEFQKAKESIYNYENSYKKNSRIYYLKHLFFSDTNNTYFDIVSAKSNLELAIKDYTHYYSAQDEKEKEKDCKKISYCFFNLTDQMINVDQKMFDKFKTSDEDLTKFIEKYGKSIYLHTLMKDGKRSSAQSKEKIEYQNSIYLDSAINLRHYIRFNKAVYDNTALAFKEFIIKNPQANEIKEARRNYVYLSYKNAEEVNTEYEYNKFLNEFLEPKIYIEKAKFKIIQLKINKIQDDFSSFIEKNSETINTLTNFQGLSIDSISLVTIYYNNYDNINNQVIKQINVIKDFKKSNSEKYESIDFILENLNSINEKINFLNIVNKREFSTSEDYSNFLNSYSASKFSNIISIQKQHRDELTSYYVEKIRIYKDSIAQIEYLNNQKVEAELEKERKKQQEEIDPNFQFYKRLGESDTKLLKKIMNKEMDLDPKQKANTPCGTGLTYCKYCSKSFYYNKEYESRGFSLILTITMNSVITPEFIELGSALENNLKRAFYNHNNSSKKTNFDEIINKRVASVKKELNAIRSGNFYTCGGIPPNYCSVKCEREANYR
jgi:hypothetical protein